MPTPAEREKEKFFIRKELMVFTRGFRTKASRDANIKGSSTDLKANKAPKIVAHNSNKMMFRLVELSLKKTLILCDKDLL